MRSADIQKYMTGHNENNKPMSIVIFKHLKGDVG